MLLLFPEHNVSYVCPVSLDSCLKKTDDVSLSGVQGMLASLKPTKPASFCSHFGPARARLRQYLEASGGASVVAPVTAGARVFGLLESARHLVMASQSRSSSRPSSRRALRGHVTFILPFLHFCHPCCLCRSFHLLG